MISLKTLGGVSVWRDGVVLTGRTTQRRRIALLALLGVAGPRGLSRQKILAYLWPEHDSDRARHALSQLLYAIRRDLGPDCISAGVDELRLDESQVACDVREFERARAGGDLERAALIYDGPFLDGFFVPDAPEFERWAESERQRLIGVSGGILAALGAAATGRGDLAQAVEWRRRRAALEPLNSDALLALLQACEAAGERAAALRYGEAHVALLEAELGVQPDDAVSKYLRALATEPRPHRGVMDREAPAAPLATHSQSAARDAADATVLVSYGPAAGEARANRSSVSDGDTKMSGSRRRWAIVAITALAALVVWWTWFASGTAVTHRVVLGAVVGPDSLLNLAVREALEAELSATPGIRLLSAGSVEQSLALMKHAAGTPVSEPLAVSIAERRGIPFALVARAQPLGDGAEITLRLADTRDQDEAPEVLLVRAPGPDDVLREVRRLASRVAKLVGSRSGRGDPDSLPAVSTSSLAALRLYAAARQALRSGDRWNALHHAVAAVRQDSTFAMAHYLAGDLAWFLDRQSLSDRHFTEAVRLGDRLPLRERLLVRARYLQIVRDEPDSALTYWYQLHALFPDDAMAYEGRAWTHRALGSLWDAYVAADSALLLDPGATTPNNSNRLQALLAMPDTALAFRLADSLGSWAAAPVRQARAQARGDWDEALRIIDEAYPPMPRCGSYWAAPARQGVLLAANRVSEAARELERILCWADGFGGWPLAQMYIPNVLLLQGRAEVLSSATRERAVGYARRALDFVDSADISIPAVARLAERVADIAARGGDAALLERAQRLVRRRDGGAGFRSFRLALLTMDAAEAFARGDMATAAELSRRARQQTFFGRGIEIPYLIEADARAAMGQAAQSDSLYRDSRAPAAFRSRR